LTLDPAVATIGAFEHEGAGRRSAGPRVVRGIQSAAGRWWRRVANQVGKRYQCNACGTEMIVTKGGSGELQCCGQQMQLK
jgi:hypothetical protein